ncbi:hypothetical protein EYF80_009637 [Liparis tanakae]|uniref:Uncharacterized protein n=1 Tax=Liparis tanakae TaxID=230148 RepID=A0A4Z2IQI7_9TELE|nr:hypothetical protein EYF80_009637 [Liparis tanakae]
MSEGGPVGEAGRPTPPVSPMASPPLKEEEEQNKDVFDVGRETVPQGGAAEQKARSPMVFRLFQRFFTYHTILTEQTNHSMTLAFNHHMDSADSGFRCKALTWPEDNEFLVRNMWESLRAPNMDKCGPKTMRVPAAASQPPAFPAAASVPLSPPPGSRATSVLQSRPLRAPCDPSLSRPTLVLRAPIGGDALLHVLAFKGWAMCLHSTQQSRAHKPRNKSGGKMDASVTALAVARTPPVDRGGRRGERTCRQSRNGSAPGSAGPAPSAAVSKSEGR